MLTETDCEDQGTSALAEGCRRTTCQSWPGNGAGPVGEPFVKRARYGILYWTCPKCEASYGEVKP